MEAADGYDGDMETLITYMDVSTLPGGVYFAGINNNVGYMQDTVLTYTTTLINIGNGFNAETGEFSAPIAGSYEFSLTLHGNSAELYVRVNGQNTFNLLNTQGPWDYDARIFHLKLQEGDKVSVNLHSGQIYTNSMKIMTFIGRLVTEL